MGLPKTILIDTNIIIHLEDNKETAAHYADLTRICAESGIQVCAHESSVADINRDKNTARKTISLSKIQKYPLIKKTPIPIADKAKKFGAIRTPNDEVDTDLLVSVNYDVADLLVTEDKEIAGRAKTAGISNKVLNVEAAVALLRDLLDTVLVKYVNVDDMLCNQFNPDDLFFESLKQDYPQTDNVKGFALWFKDCMAQQRPCWLIKQDGAIGGLVIYKDESRSVARVRTQLNT